MASTSCTFAARSLHQALPSYRTLDRAQRCDFTPGIATLSQATAPPVRTSPLSAPIAFSQLREASSSDQISSFGRQVNPKPFGFERQKPRHARQVVVAAANPFAQLLTRISGNTTEKREELKGELLDLISGLERGAEASAEEKAEVDKLASRLEAITPNPKSLSTPLISGKWKLLYTTSESILGTKRPKLLRPNGPIFQYIDAEALAAKNTETWPFFNQVTAKLTPESPSKVKVQFQYFKIFGLVSVKAPESARGFLDTTYVDDDLRISRGDKGNLFIL
ncbi:hypothetical protein KFL_000750060 [Klebsormidium nitens]|uniref:Plastid lipid-associated protein/fibrillin conserved domain-containing protein n=1 Tax=Klebsormidium nitens TaxID=105231 RepID=A0A0U9HIX7_KLENI|nr:hypothetical protein KFL_000750060 [Klebsormidium nitens]|eukprot:GAQ81237.1 hypothetical protein KFL_000750060 [Klebsormidium nitens]